MREEGCVLADGLRRETQSITVGKAWQQESEGSDLMAAAVWKQRLIPALSQASPFSAVQGPKHMQGGSSCLH